MGQSLSLNPVFFCPLDPIEYRAGIKSPGQSAMYVQQVTGDSVIGKYSQKSA